MIHLLVGLKNAPETAHHLRAWSICVFVPESDLFLLQRYLRPAINRFIKGRPIQAFVLAEPFHTGFCRTYASVHIFVQFCNY